MLVADYLLTGRPSRGWPPAMYDVLNVLIFALCHKVFLHEMYQAQNEVPFKLKDSFYKPCF
jgi:hypothetical protein